MVSYIDIRISVLERILAGIPGVVRACGMCCQATLFWHPYCFPCSLTDFAIVPVVVVTCLPSEFPEVKPNVSLPVEAHMWTCLRLVLVAFRTVRSICMILMTQKLPVFYVYSLPEGRVDDRCPIRAGTFAVTLAHWGW